MRQNCIQIADSEIKDAWQKQIASDETNELKENPKIQILTEILEFLDTNNLLDNAFDLKDQFENFIETTEANI